LTHVSSVEARAHQVGIIRPLVMLFALIALLAIPLAAPSSVEAASLKDQISAAKKRQNALSKSIGRQESLLNGLKSDQATTKAALRDTTKQLDNINVDQKRVKKQIGKALAALDRATERHTMLVDDLRQTDYTVGLLEQELASGEDDLKARRQALGQRLAEAYRAETSTLLEQVFTAESFSDALTETSAYLAYGDQDAQLAQAITEDQQALDTLRLLTTSTRLRTDQLRRDTIDTQNDIKARRDELNKAKRRLFKLEKKTERIEKAQEARYRQLVKNEKQARREYAKMRAAKASLQRKIAAKVRAVQAAASRRFGGRSGGVKPGGKGFFAWPARGQISGEYGCSSFRAYPPGGGCAHFHDGIDIAGPTGTPVYSAGDGIVAFVGYRADGAYVVVIGHAGGLETVYGHLLARAFVRVGSVVRKGARIGSMGCTGFCTGPHVHWEVSRGFQTMNPRSFM
jgi:murein DD-endopeptidase MepM/ murein hydrolase activator NlpD